MIASELVTAAMRQLGVLASGTVPEAAELADGLREITWMLKSWASRGVNQWRVVDAGIVIPANAATVNLPADCIDVIDARLMTTYERMLQRWEEGQYRQLPNKAQSGLPSAYYVSRATNVVSLSVWPVPAAAMTVRYTYARLPADVTDGTQTIDLPLQHTEAAYCALAARLAQQFGVTRIDPATAKIVTQRAAALEQIMLDQDRPASVFMGAYDGRYF